MTAGLIAFFAGLAVLIGFYALFAPKPSSDDPVAAAPTALSAKRGLFDRWVRPAVSNILPQTPGALRSFARNSDNISVLLARTDNPWRVSPEEYVVVRVGSVVFGGMLLLVLSALGLFPIPVYFAVPAGLLIGYIAPKAMLDGAWAKRRRDLTAMLPEALDLLRICMNAGFNFPNALKQTVELLQPSVTKTELSRVSAELNAGRTLNAALESFARRCPVESAESFVRSISQAQATGADIASTLAYQSSESRAEYERLVETKAAKLQTTLFLPLIGFFLPTLLILLFGPAVVTLMGSL